MKKIRIGTRGSRLALRQTEIVAEKLKAIQPDIEIEIIEIKTTGDKFLDVSLSKIGGKGLFIKEIEDALIKGEIDVAVHSLKDMPAEVHEDLILAAYLEREDPSDCLISRESISLEKLPPNAVVGTSSLRRVCQLMESRPDITIKPLRGNVLTRLKKLDNGEFDAIVLASAGLIRLGLEERITQRFDTEVFIPAVCQGIICVETRRDDSVLIELLKDLDHKASRLAATCERAFLKQLNGNCKIPLGAYCRLIEETDSIHISAMLGKEESGKVYRRAARGTLCEAVELGYGLAVSLLEDSQD